MSNPKKALGNAGEQKVVDVAKALGLDASRQPGSGVYKDFPNDVVVENLLVESKVRATHLNAKGARILSLDLDWLKQVEAAAKREGFEQGILFVRAKNSPRLLVLADGAYFLATLAKLKRES